MCGVCVCVYVRACVRECVDCRSLSVWVGGSSALSLGLCSVSPVIVISDHS